MEDGHQWVGMVVAIVLCSIFVLLGLVAVLIWIFTRPWFIAITQATTVTEQSSSSPPSSPSPSGGEEEEPSE
jgi:cytoskeletal protein RodZ